MIQYLVRFWTQLKIYETRRNQEANRLLRRSLTLFLVQLHFLTVPCKLADKNLILAVPFKVLPRDRVCGSDASCAIGGHKLEKCEQFSAKSREDKLKFVRDRKLCENCLYYTHFANGCKCPRACNVEQCTIKRKHLGSLHDALLASFRRRQEENRDQEPSLSSSSSDMRTQGASVSSSASVMQTQSDHVVMKSSISVAGGRQECRALPIVPVKVKGRGRDEIITTYALLDNGSTSTWCSEGLAKKLGVAGPRIQVSLSTIEKDSNPTSCFRISPEIMDMDEVNMIELPEVLTKEKLIISTDGISCQDDVLRWPHLSGIQVSEKINAEVELLIGQDVPEALEPSEVRSRHGCGPYATKTKFGWTLNGPLGRRGRLGVCDVNFVRADEVLSQQFNLFMNLEFSESVSEEASTYFPPGQASFSHLRRTSLMVIMKLQFRGSFAHQICQIVDLSPSIVLSYYERDS